NRTNGMTKQTKKILIHVCVWVVYCIFHLFLFSLITTISDDLWIETIINFASGILLFYFLVLFVLPKNAAPIGIFKFIWRLFFALLIIIAFRRTLILLMAEYSDFGGVVVTNLKFFMVSSFDLFTRFGIYAGIFW